MDGVGRVLCVCVSEYRTDEEGVDLEDLFRMSYTRKYISLAQPEAGGCGGDNQWTCVHVGSSSIRTGRVRASKNYLGCHINLLLKFSIRKEDRVKVS